MREPRELEISVEDVEKISDEDGIEEQSHLMKKIWRSFRSKLMLLRLMF